MPYQLERRKLARLPLEVVVRFRVPGTCAMALAETRNVSARGIYFCTGCRGLECGQELECVLVLPEKLTLSPVPMLVGCRGKVLRMQPEPPGELVGVALEIFSYDFSGAGELNLEGA
ncbi:MAG TPA: PilZ domain-containing protein [Candidatus Limnocylindrales bacterium]|nr:PilZ domain-containing protein [Candidatus Limnocylindrales bacterium]